MTLTTNILFSRGFLFLLCGRGPYVKRAATFYGAKVSLVHVFDPASYNGFELYVRRQFQVRSTGKSRDQSTMKTASLYEMAS